MRTKLLRDVGVHHRARLAVDDLVHRLDRLAVEDRKLEEIGVRHDAGDGEAPGAAISIWP